MCVCVWDGGAVWKKGECKKKNHYPLHSLSEFTSFHFSHCSPNEERSFCLRVHLATKGDFCHAAEKDLIRADWERASSSHPNKERRIYISYPDFLFSPFNLLHGNSLKKKKEERETGWKAEILLLLWLIFNTLFCSGSPHCTWDRRKAQRSLWELDFMSKTGLQSTCCYCSACKSRDLWAKMDVQHYSGHHLHSLPTGHNLLVGSHLNGSTGLI